MRRILPVLFLLACSPASDVDVDASLAERIAIDDLMGHLEALQAIADDHDGNRAAGTEGYAASVAYAAGVLEEAGYAVQRVPFTVSGWEVFAPTVVAIEGGEAFEAGVDVAAMTYSAAGDVTAPVAAVDLLLPPAAEPSSTSGCEAEDFAAFPSGSIALIQRGGCFFQDKVALAEAAGAVGVVVFNEGQAGRRELEGWQLDPAGEVAIPVAGASYATGATLAAALDEGPVSVQLAIDAGRIAYDSESLLADTPGDPEHTIVVGGHLDSVLAGPGINDNGTGTALILELARHMAAGEAPEHRVRFALWGAEEVGLVGSSEYVYNLDETELGQIRAKLNFDMIGSPNGTRFVYDGDGDAYGEEGPSGSGAIEALFEAWFADEDLASLPTPFDGRSDYYGFIDLGIPAGGLFSGAEGTKTEQEAATFGGTAGEPRDACYHRECDDIANIDQDLFLDLAQASAFVTEQLATRDLLPAVSNARVPTPAPLVQVGGCGHHDVIRE